MEMFRRAWRYDQIKSYNAISRVWWVFLVRTQRNRMLTEMKTLKAQEVSVSKEDFIGA